jgi:hypothetical protein
LITDDDIQKLSKNDTSWNYYRDSSDNEVDLILYGEFGNYDGSGYIYDFYYREDLTGESTSTDDPTIAKKYAMNYATLKRAGWFDKSTRAFVVTFCLYDPNSDKWISTLLLFELSVSGIVHPT